MRKLSLIIMMLALANGCGRDNDDKQSDNDVNRAQEQRIAELEAELETRTQALEAKQGELDAQQVEAQTALNLRDGQVADLEAQVSAAETKRAALAEQIKDLEASGQASAEELTELKKQKLALDRQIDALKNDLSEAQTAQAAAEEKLAAVTAEKDALSQRVADLNEEAEELRRQAAAAAAQVAMIERLTAPFQGLRYTDLESASAVGRCTMAVSVDKLTYTLAVTCVGEDDSYQTKVERGSISNVAGGLRESASQLDTDRELTLTPQLSSCTTDAFATTASLEWSQAATDMLRANFSNDSSTDGLLAGDAGRDTATCAEVLARPDRAGLETVVAACKVISLSDSELTAAANVGCLNRDGDRLSFSAQAVGPVNQ